MIDRALAQTALVQALTQGRQIQNDAWGNEFLGYNTAKDRTAQGAFSLEPRINDQELSWLYHHSDMARRVVRLVPRQMLRAGFNIECQDAAAQKAVTDKFRALDGLNCVEEAFTLGRLFGGSLIFIGADDGLDPAEPLKLSKVRNVHFLAGYDRRRVLPETYYTDSRKPKFGEPAVYRLSALRTGGVSYVHESRCIVFRGAHTAAEERIPLLGWDYSILQSCRSRLRAFDDAFKAAELLLSDASQGVLTIHGLFNMIAGGDLQEIQTRAVMFDMLRGITRSIMLDADKGESYTKVATSFAGVADMLDRAAQRLSAATEIPMLLLMGKAEAGLGNTTDGPIRLWYDNLASEQERDLKPRLLRLIEILAQGCQVSGRAFDITFPPLWQETAQEKSARDLVDASAAEKWITNEVLTPEEVGKARFGGKEPQPYRIDPGTRAPMPGAVPGVPLRIPPRAPVALAPPVIKPPT